MPEGQARIRLIRRLKCHICLMFLVICRIKIPHRHWGILNGVIFHGCVCLSYDKSYSDGELGIWLIVDEYCKNNITSAYKDAGKCKGVCSWCNNAK